MSEIKTDKLTGKTTAGDVTITSEGGSATMQLQQGVAKMFINMNGLNTISTRDSFNIASITDTGTGNYYNNSTNPMSNDDFACVYNSGNGSGANNDQSNPGDGFTSSHVNSTTQAALECTNDSGSNTDREYHGGTWHGDLA